jgi:phage-related protein (TIGR01555 family)
MFDWFKKDKPKPEVIAPIDRSGIRKAAFKASLMANDSFNIQPKSYPVKAPVLFAGVVPKGETPAIAMDAASYDYASSAYAGQGFPGYPYLAGLSTRAEYRNMAASLSTEVTRQWLRITSSETDDDASKDKITLLEKEIERIGLKEAVQLASSHDALFGRGQLFINLRGHDRETPLILSPKTIAKGSLESVKAIEAMWTTPQAYNTIDPAAPDFYKPLKWHMLGQPVHSSRLMTIITRPVPDMLKPAFNFSGISLSQIAEPYVENWLRTRQSVSDMLWSFSLTALSTDMGQVLMGGDGGEDLLARADLFNTVRSNRGLMLLDKDREELSQINTPLGGLHELQAQAQEHMCAVSRMPAIVLTGISPSGLNASSEGEIKAFYDWVAAQQSAYWHQPIMTVLKVAQLSLFGEIDEDIGIEFNSLERSNPSEESAIRQNDANAAATLIDRGVLDPSEERERLARDRKGVYHGLDVSAMPEQDDDEPDDDTSGGKKPETVAQDADKWITVHPNGKDTTGTPALIGEGGVIKGGMGGKFNGKNIKDAHGTKNFTSGETNAETAARNEAAQEPAKPSEAAQPAHKESKESAKDKFARIEGEYKSDIAKIQHLKKYDRLQSEGHSGGYSSYDDEAEKIYSKYKDPLKQAKEEMFAEEWTPDVLEKRRAEWNAAIQKNMPKTTREKGELEKRLGYTLEDIKKAKELPVAK